MSEVKLTVNEQSNDVESLKKEINNLTEENKNLKTEKRDLKNEMRLMEAEIRSLNKKIIDGDIGSEDVDIKCDKNNAYSNNVRQTVIQLMSNVGVSAENCSKVIKIVSEGVCNKKIHQKLPCGQTCLNIALEGQVISDIHTAESVLSSDAVAVHSDGTSRDPKKVVNHQITTDKGHTFFLGFTIVATEDANTVFDVTINILRRIVTTYCDFKEKDQNEIFVQFLKKIRATMTDRAAVMKCFSKKFEEFLSSEIGEDVQLKLLNCNAHFLLGMSGACDKAFKKVEADIKHDTNEAIGRDKDKQFSRFSGEGETCTSRVIRVACDILGPPGDQKSGLSFAKKASCLASREIGLTVSLKPPQQ